MTTKKHQKIPSQQQTPQSGLAPPSQAFMGQESPQKEICESKKRIQLIPKEKKTL
jgi:hypothetical protein